VLGDDFCMKKGKIIDLKKLSVIHNPLEFEIAEKIFSEVGINPFYYHQHVIY
jgi:hypothetical protein